MTRIAILDDYQNVALGMADWTPLDEGFEIDTFTDHLTDGDALVERLLPYEVVVVMRERTPVPAALLEQLPRLKLLITTGRRNASIDVAAANGLGITVCGTQGSVTATPEHTWALILALSRHIHEEANNIEQGRWQTTVGSDLAGRTIGIVGLGRIGSRVATVANAFGMQVLAWSHNLTDERAREAGAVRAATLDRLLAESDVVTIHQVLSDRTRGLIGAAQLAAMKSDAILVNTSRAPIVDTDALITALEQHTIGGAAVDVFDIEPLPADDPLRRAPNTLLTPHLGYVTRGGYRTFYTDAVEDILAFYAGEPVRIL